MHPLTVGEAAATPWAINPLWFAAACLAAPMIVWLLYAFRRALAECPTRMRRSGLKEMRRLLKRAGRSEAGTGIHLRAWQRAAARSWNVKSSAPLADEVSKAAGALSGDAESGSRWRELWTATEHALYAPDRTLPPDWYERATAAVAEIRTPKRERIFPNRLHHWLPSVMLAVLVVTTLVPLTTHADVPPSAPATNDDPADAPRISEEVQQRARQALQTNWNDWAAHHNLALYEAQTGDLNLAIAHATAAFVQHPAPATREALQTTLGDTPEVDPQLKRLLSGAWYERAPALMSPAGWQRLALIASFIGASALLVMVLALYSTALRAHTRWARSASASGVVVLALSTLCWNAYGTLKQPRAAMLVQGVNLSPVPTELIPEAETSPITAGSVVVARGRFLGWREISGGPSMRATGWVRENALMPLYASRP